MTRPMVTRSLLTVAAIAGVLVSVARSQSAAPASFEVASIKLNRSGQNWTNFNSGKGGRFNVVNASLLDLIRIVYQIQDFQLEGAPDWTASDRYDIAAKAEGDQELSPLVVVPGQDPPAIFTMVRSLLEERFKLAVHRETKDAAVYDLVFARPDRRLGTGISLSTTDCDAVRAARRVAAASSPQSAIPPPPPPPPAPNERVVCGLVFSPGSIRAGTRPLSALATSLTRFAHRPIVDRTGLPGNYDFTLEFMPELPPRDASDTPAAATDRPSIFTALQEQLGLKLESARGQVEFLVIDHVEHPTEN